MSVSTKSIHIAVEGPPIDLDRELCRDECDVDHRNQPAVEPDFMIRPPISDAAVSQQPMDDPLRLGRRAVARIGPDSPQDRVPRRPGLVGQAPLEITSRQPAPLHRPIGKAHRIRRAQRSQVIEHRLVDVRAGQPIASDDPRRRNKRPMDPDPRGWSRPSVVINQDVHRSRRVGLDSPQMRCAGERNYALRREDCRPQLRLETPRGTTHQVDARLAYPLKLTTPDHPIGGVCRDAGDHELAAGNDTALVGRGLMPIHRRSVPEIASALPRTVHTPDAGTDSRDMRGNWSQGPGQARSSAICTALRAAPLRRLSLLMNRLSAFGPSWRMRPT
jgi:hypothetical protein